MANPDDDAVFALLDEGRLDDAVARVLRRYGPEVGGFIAARTGRADEAADIFAVWSVDVWKGLEGFRREASLRTWLYTLARRAAYRTVRDKKSQPFAGLPAVTSSQLERIAAEVRTSTAAFMRTEVKEEVRRLRESLAEDERELLVLRVDRHMEWNDIAAILFPDDEPGAHKKRSASLRKRFERTKEKLKTLAAQRGLL